MAKINYPSSTSNTAMTIEDFINLQRTDEITYYNYSILEYLNGFDMFITNLLYDYEDELRDIAVRIELSDLERAQYRYKPNLLAYKLYGSPQMGFILMMLNNIIDPKEFDFDYIIALKKSDLLQILSRIKSVNLEFIRNNRAKLNSDFAKNQGNAVWSD